MAEAGLGGLWRRKGAARTVRQAASASGGLENPQYRTLPNRAFQTCQWQNGTFRCEFGTAGCWFPSVRGAEPGQWQNGTPECEFGQLARGYRNWSPRVRANGGVGAKMRVWASAPGPQGPEPRIPRWRARTDGGQTGLRSRNPGRIEELRRARLRSRSPVRIEEPQPGPDLWKPLPVPLPSRPRHRRDELAQVFEIAQVQHLARGVAVAARP